MPFDIKSSNLSEKAEVGFEFEVLMPGHEVYDEEGERMQDSDGNFLVDDSKRTGAFFKIRGGQSTKVKEFFKKNTIEMELRHQNRNPKAKKTRSDLERDQEEAENFTIDLCCLIVMGLRGFEEAGKELEFNEDNLRRVLKENFWMTAQISEQAGKLENFM